MREQLCEGVIRRLKRPKRWFDSAHHDTLAKKSNFLVFLSDLSDLVVVLNLLFIRVQGFNRFAVQRRWFDKLTTS